MSELPAEVKSWIGQNRYEQEGEFDVERGYIFTSCASVENGNPLFWDEKVTQDLTGGWIAPPSMLSAWFRPHYWAPNRTEVAQPLQIHFDLKADNLLCDLRDLTRPVVKVSDLGLAKLKAQTFVSGNMRGTLPWMAPELFPTPPSASSSHNGSVLPVWCMTDL